MSHQWNRHQAQQRYRTTQRHKRSRLGLLIERGLVIGSLLAIASAAFISLFTDNWRLITVVAITISLLGFILAGVLTAREEE